jgi:hypothetical protein
MRLWRAVTKARTAAYLWFTLLEVLLSTAIHAGFAFTIAASAVAREVLVSLRTEGAAGSVAGAWSVAKSFTGYIADAEQTPLELRREIARPPPGSSNRPEDVPIVLVHGIFGFGNQKLCRTSYWGGAEFRAGNIIVSDVGALASLHDRACELFYQLKGGTVDYGEAHSRACGHHRYGKTWKGFYPEWDAKHPLHFVGHSSGAQTVRLLHTMLAEGRFAGYPKTSAKWVLSVTSLSGSLNGTTRVYLDGLCATDGTTLRHPSLLSVLAIAVIIFHWLDIEFLKKFYDFGFDHFGLSWHQAGVTGLLEALLGKRGPFASTDWILPDLSIQSSVKLNKQLQTYPDTYYFSYATTQTTEVQGHHVPAGNLVHPLFVWRVLQIGSWSHPADHPLPYEGFRDEDWRENDGALNTFSQVFPRVPDEHPNCYVGAKELRNGLVMKPGVWYYTLIRGDHIHYIINPARGGNAFLELYDSIFDRCRNRLEWEKGMDRVDSVCRCLRECMCEVT